MNRHSLASEIAFRDEGKKRNNYVADIRKIIRIIEDIAVEEMIANMDGKSDSLSLLEDRSRQKAIKKLNKLVPGHPKSLTRDWGKR